MVLVATVAIYVSFGILLWSGISHAVFQKAFVASLSSQRIWRQGTEPFIGVIVSILELTVGLGGFIGLAFSFEVDAFLFGPVLSGSPLFHGRRLSGTEPALRPLRVLVTQ